MIKQYRKKPVVIDALYFDGQNQTEILDWINGGQPGEYKKGIATYGAHGSDNSIHIQTLEGEMLAQPHDYIIKGVKGEFYPCKPDIFNATYEEVK